MNRFHDQLGAADVSFRKLIQTVPLQRTPPLPPEWLRCEMLERYLVLQQASVPPNITALEVGCGAHAITTVPLAHLTGPGSRVVAIDRDRWSGFRAIVRTTGMSDRIQGVACDARHLPLPDDAVALAACVHGVRSLRSEATMVAIFAEMLRVAPRIVVAESLPVAHTAAQEAHLAMYGLREEAFRATTGRPDDLHYLPLELLTSLVERAGGAVLKAEALDIDLPHFLAVFPSEIFGSIADPSARDDLRRRWDEARTGILRSGEDHPPVGLVVASRSRSS